MLCHLPWAYRHSHPPYGPSGGWWPQRPLPSGAFTALLPRAHPSHSTSFWSSCACPCSLCLSVPGACEMSHLTLVTVEPLACFSGGSSVQGEGMLSILSGLHQERFRLHLGLDTAPCLAAGETASHLARVPRRELPGAWVTPALKPCVLVCECALCSPVLSACVYISAAVVLSTVGKVVVLLMQEPELLFYLLL